MKVVSVVLEDTQEVWDISVEGCHSFCLANGAVVHNCEKHFMGWEPSTFEETLGDSTSFQYLDPSEGYQYACADAEATYALAGATAQFYKEAKFCCDLDNAVLYPLMKFEDKPLSIDVKMLREMASEETKKVEELDRAIYDAVGYEFAIQSNKQLGEALSSVGVNTGKFTSKGMMKVDIKTLALIKKQHPVIEKIIERSKKVKAIGSYMESLADQAEKKNGFLRFSYLSTAVPTGRLACGSDKKNAYFAHINVQCLSGDSKVLTLRGLLDIRDVVAGDMIWTGFAWRTVHQKFCNGFKSVKRVTLSNGSSLVCTDQHRFYSAVDDCSFRELKDLKVGDQVAWGGLGYQVGVKGRVWRTGQIDRPKGGLRRREFVIDLDKPETWEVLGYFVGDGCFKERRGIQLTFSWKETDAYDRIKRDLRAVGWHYREFLEKKTGYRDLPGLVVEGAGLYDALVEMGFQRGAKNKSIPKELFSLGISQRCAFIRGLLAADGNSFKGKNSWSLRTVSKTLSEEFSLLLLSVGIPNTYHDYRGVYQVNLSGNKDRLRDLIGIIDPVKDSGYSSDNKCGRKLSRVPQCLRPKQRELGLGWFEKPKGGKYFTKSMDFIVGTSSERDFSCYWLEIAKIEDAGEEEVFDLHVEGEHEYQANGFIVHNSIPKPHPKMWFVHDFHEGDEVRPGEVVIEDWLFSVDRQSDYQIEGFDQKNNIRSAFTVDKNCYWISTDFSAEELRITANLASETLWIDTMLHGGDLHKAMAIAMWGEENYTKEMRKRAKCVVGTTRVVTDKGLVQIKDLQPCMMRPGEYADLKVAVVGKDGIKPTTGFYYDGVQKTKKVTFSNGVVLEGTLEHSLWDYKSQSWRTLGELKVGDQVEMALNKDQLYVGSYQWQQVPFVGETRVKITEDVAYLVGAVLGDGAVSQHHVKFLSVDRELLDKVSKIAVGLGLSDGTIYLDDKYGDKLHAVNCGGKNTRILFDALGVSHDKVKDLRVPEIIFKSPVSVIGKFLQGLFDTDGTVGHKDPRNSRISFTTRSESFARETQQLLLYLGIGCILTGELNKAYKRWYWKVSIFRAFAERFQEVVGFSQNQKREQLKKLVELGVKRDSRVDRVIVKKIEDGEAECFDICTVGDHSFTASGLVSRNTANFGLIYGMSPFSMPDKFNEPLEVCQEIYDKFWKAVPNIKAFQEKIIRRARRVGTVYNFLGRPRRVKFWFNSGVGKDYGFACRTCANTVVQSMGGEILKIAMLKLWKNLFNVPRFEDAGVRFLNTIHDEVNTQCPRSLVREVCAIQKRCMDQKFPNWPLPIECSLELGPSWGCTFPFIWTNDDRVFLPKMEPVKK